MDPQTHELFKDKFPKLSSKYHPYLYIEYTYQVYMSTDLTLFPDATKKDLDKASSSKPNVFTVESSDSEIEAEKVIVLRSRF